MILVQRQSVAGTKVPDKEDAGDQVSGLGETLPDYQIKFSENILIFNIRGNFFEVFESTLDRFKDTLLGSSERLEYLDSESGEYVFDTDPQIFYTILHFYQTSGQLHCSPNVQEERFLSEVKFFRLTKYYLKLNNNDDSDEEEAVVKRSNLVWKFLEKPNSSLGAKVWSYLSILFIIAAITLFMLETIPSIEREINKETSMLQFQFFCIETTCIAFFTLELLIRGLACPQFKSFIRNILNWVDFISILPYYIGLIFPRGIAHIFVVLRVLRVVRVLRLARHSDGIKIIFISLSTSVSELLFLIFFWSLAIILFGSLIHYSEGNTNPNFDSIPRSAWWVVVTMSSVGYGDCVPKTALGRVIGSFCIMSCMLVLALPMTVIISKVTRTYHAYIQKTNRREMRRQYNIQRSRHPECHSNGVTSTVSKA